MKYEKNSFLLKSLWKSYFIWLPWHQAWSEKLYVAKNIIWISGYHFTMLQKGYQNFDFFHKIWKTCLEWYTSALGMKWIPLVSNIGLIMNMGSKKATSHILVALLINHNHHLSSVNYDCFTISKIMPFCLLNFVVGDWVFFPKVVGILAWNIRCF